MVNQGRTAALRRSLGLLMVALAACAPAHAQVPRSDAEDTVADGGAVIPDSGGRIRELLLYYDPLMDEELAPLYDDLFGALGDDLLIRVICPDARSAQRFADRWGKAALGEGRDVECVAVGMPLTIWARDRCIARQSRTLLRRASSFVPADERDYPEEKRNDRMVQALLSLAGLLPGMYSSSLQLEGGNVVSNRRQVFVGANVIEENEALYRSGALPAELRRVFGRPYVLVGDDAGMAPWCHVDMYLTPIDDRTVLLASPQRGRKLLQDAANAGDERALEVLQEIDHDVDEEPIFDATAERLEARGYRVLRMPAAIDRTDDWMITYNNVLLERSGGKQIAYVPQYRVPALDDAARALYADLGFDVRQIDVSGIYELGGALRCVANVTERAPEQSRTPRRRSRSKGATPPRVRGITMINLAPNLLWDDDCTDDESESADRGSAPADTPSDVPADIVPADIVPADIVPAAAADIPATRTALRGAR
ncbi:MAG TPA: agmatine deiminase family protein [Phycisphaerae bacterium]|nr:agmatine deiminase family protein [Phycisphaerales bacterium]HRX86822.1 agmatine deiminase family protein [Phycisphaerae bacterium]